MYNWQRFWCPRDAFYPLTPKGYLADPTVLQRSAVLSHIKATEQLTERPCLVMLGEPGSGKTTEIDALRTTYVPKEGEIEERVHSVDLRSVGSEQRLITKVFESPEFTEWRNGTYRLNLFLDSLDECLLRVATVATILADELPQYPIARLTLRIACRTAVWPSVLEAALYKLWGKEALGIYELLPLREVDVATAGRTFGVEPTEFLRKVADARAVPFAIKPVTLAFLLQKYVEDGKLPESQYELYREGCRILCEEQNLSRRGTGMLPLLNSDERLAIAARIAAVAVFCQKLAISTAADTGGLSDQILPVRLLTGGTEPSANSAPSVSENALREVLDTGLFSSRGQDLMGWAHQTYAEFLASYWVCQHHLSLANIRTLIDHTAEGAFRVVPQLYETAAWIATERADVLEHIVEIEPHILLRSDVAAMDAATRAQITAQLLVHFETGRLAPGDVLYSAPLRNLDHPTLVQQLRPYLRTSSKNDASRWAAVDIAEACKLTDLQDDLADLALDGCASHHLRWQAAYAVSRIADATCRARLLPIATVSVEEDPDDNLRGCALIALWPECITAEQLFSFVTQPYHQSHGGIYQLFLRNHFTRFLKPSDLPLALRWIITEVGAMMSLNSLADPAGEIMRMAWDHLDDPGVIDALADVAFLRLENYDNPFHNDHETKTSQAYYPDDIQRRQLIEKLVERTIHEESRQQVRFNSHHLVSRADVAWLIERLTGSTDAPSRKVYAMLLLNVADLRTSDFDLLFDAHRTSDELRELCSGCFNPIQLDSDQAVEMREAYRAYKEQETRRNTGPPLLDPPPHEIILRHLATLEGGNPDAWVWLNRDLQLKPNSTHYQDDLEADLTALPGWQGADESARARIVTGAESFAIHGDQGDEEPVGSGTLSLSAMAGYRALRLLMALQPQSAIALPDEVWAKWARIILTYPYSDIDEDTLRGKVISLAYQHAPEKVIETLLLMIDRDNVQFQDTYVLRRMDQCWDLRLSSAMLEKLADSTLEVGSMRTLMEHLLSLSGEDLQPVVQQTVARAEQMISAFTTGEAENRRAQAAAAALITSLPTESWRIVWPVIQRDTEFGRHLLEHVAHAGRHNTALLETLTESQLAELYVWLEEHYPQASDTVHREMIAHFVGPDESVRTFRDGVINYLGNRGTNAACAAIESLTRSLPHLSWMNTVLLKARNLTLAKTWQPLTPQTILEMARAPKEAKMKIKVLFVSANPTGTVQLALDEEIREITIKIRASEHRDSVELISRWAVRPDDLLQALNEHKPHIVHFSGHGSPTEEIILLDNNREPKPVSKAALESLFHTLKDNVQVVMFNACFSKPQADAITQTIDCAIGMNKAIGDHAAIVFAASFYRAIGFGRSVQEAFEQGKTALLLEGIQEDQTPELLVKTGVDAARVILIR
ncbi:MAG: hypothetical protein JWL77_2802 [Chthonomonadaceae bacterium]|nr:hypothetical protein [Chthonomonadaceae bacterium]